MRQCRQSKFPWRQHIRSPLQARRGGRKGEGMGIIHPLVSALKLHCLSTTIVALTFSSVFIRHTLITDLTLWSPLGTAIQHPVTDRVKLSFVIFDIWALWRSTLSVRVLWASECPDVKNYKWQLNTVCHRMLYSCTHMATVGVKGLTHSWAVN